MTDKGSSVFSSIIYFKANINYNKLQLTSQQHFVTLLESCYFIAPQRRTHINKYNNRECVGRGGKEERNNDTGGGGWVEG